MEIKVVDGLKPNSKRILFKTNGWETLTSGKSYAIRNRVYMMQFYKFEIEDFDIDDEKVFIYRKTSINKVWRLWCTVLNNTMPKIRTIAAAIKKLWIEVSDELGNN